MKSRETLLDNLQLIINKNDYNKSMINDLAMKFNEKGFSMQRPNQIFGGASPLESLEKKELLALTKGIYDITKDKNINPKEYFSAAELEAFKKYKKAKEEIKDKLILKNAVQIDDLQWICPFWSLEEIYEAHNNAQLSYNFNTQREATYKETKTGEIIITATLNKESVKEIADEMYANKFTPNLITLNIRLIEGKKPNIKYNENTKDLAITPDYDFNSNNTTFIDMIDGWHRTNGSLWAVDRAKQENKKLKGGLVVLITCMTEEEAKNYIARESKKNDMSKEYIKSLTNDDYNKIARNINDYGDDNNNILKDKIANTREELKYTDKFTTMEIIREGLKQTDLDIKDALDVRMKLPKMIEIITILINYILKYKFKNDINELKESAFLQPNIFVGYIAIADELKNEKEYLDKLLKVVDKLISKPNKDFSGLGIYSKQLQNKKIYEYFKNLIKEVS